MQSIKRAGADLLITYFAEGGAARLYGRSGEGGQTRRTSIPSDSILLERPAMTISAARERNQADCRPEPTRFDDARAP